MIENNILKVKISLIGNSGVGKTSIISKYIKDDFSEHSNSTKGAQYSNKKIKVGDKLIEMDLWDTSGQEMYISLCRNFFKNSHIVILVYDITNKDSFEDMKNIWYNELLEYGEEYNILAIVGNKNDLYEKEEVSEYEGLNFAKEKNCLFMLVSAKNGNNINNLLNKLIYYYLKNNYKNKDTDSFKIRNRDYNPHNSINLCC